MSARTFPTPWRVQIDITPRATSVTVVCDDGEDTMVCECYEGTYEQRVSAANLIAAAPDLLDALQNMVEVADFQGMTATKAQAAIKKAIGEQP
jgi:hypothetical protein